MTVRRGPRRAPPSVLLSLRDRIGDSAVVVQALRWLELEAELSGLSRAALESLLARIEAAAELAGAEKDREWRARWEEPQRGAG